MEKRQREGGIRTWQKILTAYFYNITPEIEELALKCEKNNAIEKELYTKYEVKEDFVI